MSGPLKTLQGALRLLELFDVEHTEWGLAELSRQLKVPESSAFDQVRTLAELGMLRRTRRGHYALGWRTLKLASSLLCGLPWYNLAHRAMAELASRTGVLSFLSIWQEGKVYCIARCSERRRDGGVAGETSFELPADRTASGRLLTAAQRQGTFLGSAPVLSEDEWEPGTTAAAVPIWSGDYQVLAALGLSMRSERFSVSGPLLLRELSEAGERLSWQLGGCSPAREPGRVTR